MPAISIELALILGRAVFLVFCFVLAAVTFTRWRRAADRSAAQVTGQTTTLLTRMAVLEARIEATQSLCGAISNRLAELNGAATATVPTPSYQIAIRLARGGAPRDELMKSCGITRQEADLLQRLHAPAPPIRIAAASA